MGHMSKRDMAHLRSNAWCDSVNDRSITALDLQVGDRVILRPTWPEGRLVEEVDSRDTKVIARFADGGSYIYGASDHVVVRRAR